VPCARGLEFQVIRGIAGHLIGKKAAQPEPSLGGEVVDSTNPHNKKTAGSGGRIQTGNHAVNRHVVLCSLNAAEVRWNTNRLLENPLRVAEVRLNPPGLL
jgi:hypothetical protein